MSDPFNPPNPPQIPPWRSSLQMNRPPVIPDRTSSKRRFDELEQAQPSLDQERTSLNQKIAYSGKKLKPHNSFDSEYWNAAADNIDLRLKRNEVLSQVREYKWLKDDRARTLEEWQASRVYDEFSSERTILHHKASSFRSQAERLSTEGDDGEAQAARRAFISFFVEARSGLDVKATQNPRDDSAQSNLRTTIIQDYNLASHIAADRDLKWDVILGRMAHERDMTASHLFAQRHGKNAMKAIFGAGAENDLYSSYDGLLLSKKVEDMLEDGFFVIVPDIDDDATPEARLQWRESEPKGYKLRFLDKPTEKWVPGGGTAENHRYNRRLDATTFWRDLDGKSLEFRSSFRPRVRYLYFLFCCNILRFVWRYKEKTPELLEPELGRFFWGTYGKYMKRKMIKAFVEEIGNQFDPLQDEGDDVDDDGTQADLALGAAT